MNDTTTGIPAKFLKFPFGSVMNKSEHESIARNIMVILKRTKNEFRELPWNEYKIERLKDGGFSEGEKQFFDEVIMYCSQEEHALKFSKEWN